MDYQRSAEFGLQISNDQNLQFLKLQLWILIIQNLKTIVKKPKSKILCQTKHHLPKKVKPIFGNVQSNAISLSMQI